MRAEEGARTRAELHAAGSSCFNIRNIISAVLCVPVCACVCEGNGTGGKKPSLHVLFMGLSFIRRLPYMSGETFPYFKNSPAISEIIGPLLVLS